MARYCRGSLDSMTSSCIPAGRIVFGISHCHASVADRQTALAAAAATKFRELFFHGVRRPCRGAARPRAASRWTPNWVPGKTGCPRAPKNSSNLYACVRAAAAVTYRIKTGHNSSERRATTAAAAALLVAILLYGCDVQTGDQLLQLVRSFHTSDS